MNPMRILHVFGQVGYGGAEVWLINVLRRIDRDRFGFDFVVHKHHQNDLADELRELGSQIHIVDTWRNPPRYAADLRRVLAGRRYDVVHSHVAFYSGYVLSLARAFGVAGRIAHSHTNLPGDGDRPWRTVYKRAMRAALHASSTRGLGCSAAACESLFGPRWQSRDKYEVLLYGYDFGRFASVGAESRARTRAALGLRDGDFAIGHIGRFVRPKNHAFIVELVAASRARGRHHERFVLVGEGELQRGVEQALADRGLAGACILTGRREDIPDLMSAFDVFILPSLWEGLGIVVLEAQAAGVPCVISDRVPGEVIVLPDHVARAPIDGSNAADPRSGRPVRDVEPWLDAIDRMRERGPLPPERARAAMEDSPFGIARHVTRVETIYRGERARWSPPNAPIDDPVA